MASRYLPHGAFTEALNARVAEHLSQAPDLRWQLWLKTVVIAAWLVGGWTFLVFFAATPIGAVLGTVNVGLAMAAVGLNVMHDGGHRAASSIGGLNRLLALSVDVLGGSSYIWSWKHNVYHHSNPNTVGLDTDIDIQPLVRLAPEQQWKPWHRFQHLYVWLLYAFLAVKWQWVDDFQDCISGRIGAARFPRPRGFDLLALVAGKVFFFSWALVIPAQFHPLSHVVLAYLLASAVLSWCLAITFQAAHCVDAAEFPAADAPRVEWAAHQLRTSVDFGTGHPLWTVVLGGLNIQAVHHLFPKVSHVQLAGLVPVVSQVCEEFGVEYRRLPGFGSAIASHWRWLKHMGAGPAQG